MADYDLVIAGGTVVTPSDMFAADVGVTGGRVAAVGLNLRGQQTIDAQGLLLMPVGVDHLVVGCVSRKLSGCQQRVECVAQQS